MHDSRQHHYVQARYLDGFLQPGTDKLWAYGRGRTAAHKAIPNKLARQKDFYRFPTAVPGHNLENFLETRIETPGLRALRSLLATGQPLLVEDRIALARYIAFQENRVPRSRERHREFVAMAYRHILELLDETGAAEGKLSNVALAEGMEVQRSDSTRFTRDDIESAISHIDANPKTFDLTDMIESANKLTSFYAVMKWSVLIAKPQNSFLTSDCPVFHFFTEPGGDDALLRPDCRVCFPLSSHALLLMEHDIPYLQLSMKEQEMGSGSTLPPTSFRSITAKGVRNFNEKIAGTSHHWTYSGNPMPWIVDTMRRPSSRTRREYIVTENMFGMRSKR